MYRQHKPSVALLAATALAVCLSLSACAGGEPGTGGEEAQAGAQDPVGAEMQDPAQVEAARAAAAAARQAAEEAGTPGAMIATVNGEERVWLIDNNLTEWDRKEDGGTYVDMMGAVSAEDFSWKEAVEVQFTLHGEGEDLAVAEPRVVYFSESATRHHASSAETVVVTQAELEGETLKVAGAFSGTLRFAAYGSGSDTPEGGLPQEITLSDGAFYAAVAD